MPDAPNLIAGRYEPGRRLGGSAFAEVGAARDTHLDRPVALKVLRPAALADPAAVERLRRSALETGAVRDARIVDVYDWAAGPDGAYLAMELVDGGTLGDLLRSHGPLAPGRAVEIAATLAGGLAAVHATGVAHGALTPDSVLLTREGEARLTATSGGSAPAADADEARRFAGYCSPEVLRGATPDAAADVWSLGVVLHEALTGLPPFTGADAVAVATAVTGTAAPVPSSQRAGIPYVIDAVVARLLSHDPADRIVDAAVAEAELTRVARTVAAPPTVATRAVESRTQAMPTAAASAAAAAAAPAPRPVEPGRTTPRWIAPVLITLAVVAAALVGWLLASRNDTSKGTVTVPNVLSLRREEAATRIERAGLSVTVREEPSEAFGAGIVFDQAPNGGKRVGENSVVVITVSTGPTTTTTSSSTTSSTTTSSSSSTTTTSSTTSTTVAPTTTTAAATTTSAP